MMRAVPLERGVPQADLPVPCRPVCPALLAARGVFKGAVRCSGTWLLAALCSFLSPQ